MSHTATSIFSSPNPSILEMRILTHHSSDERFAFLRGRWRNAWDKVKGDIKGEKENKRRLEEKQRGLGGLGDMRVVVKKVKRWKSHLFHQKMMVSRRPPEVDDTIPPPPPVEESESGTLPPPQPQFSTEEDQEEEKRRQRRLRVEEWKKQRISG